MKRRPGSAAVVVLAARTYMASGKLSQAESLLKTAAQERPLESSRVRIARAEFYLSQNRLQEALREFETLAAKEPRPVGAPDDGPAWLLESMGKPRGSRQAL